MDAPLNEVHSLLRPYAAIPDGPVYPLICRAAEQMALASRESKIAGWMV